jgi:hypothetical protein
VIAPIFILIYALEGLYRIILVSER